MVGGLLLTLQTAQASGSGGYSPRADTGFSKRAQRSPAQIENDRLYTLGRKTFKRKLTCRKGCILTKGTIKRDNAREYLAKINEDAQFTSALSRDEIRAISIYMEKKYKIKT